MNQKGEFTPPIVQTIAHSKNFNVFKMFDEIKDGIEHTHQNQDIKEQDYTKNHIKI